MEGIVTGIGGIFFVANDPKTLNEWYAKHLGMTTVFLWEDAADKSKKGYTVWNTFSRSSSLFRNYSKDYIFNYRVDHLSPLLERLGSNDIKITEPTTEDENGTFAFIEDLEGNKIILWEPSPFVPASKPLVGERVTGPGGLFFKSEDVPKLKAWYGTNLGFDITPWGCTFRWIDPQDPGAKVPARTEWSPFKADTDYYLPSSKEFMMNYRVKDLVTLLANLTEEGVEVVGEMEQFSYGKFGWIMDPEQNKIELWEPKDEGFDAT
jgi:predicted enzyme related to lactoylglutathione lyase